MAPRPRFISRLATRFGGSLLPLLRRAAPGSRTRRVQDPTPVLSLNQLEDRSCPTTWVVDFGGVIPAHPEATLQGQVESRLNPLSSMSYRDLNTPEPSGRDLRRLEMSSLGRGVPAPATTEPGEPSTRAQDRLGTDSFYTWNNCLTYQADHGLPFAIGDGPIPLKVPLRAVSGMPASGCDPGTEAGR